jgi:hypothetical protein
LGGVVHTQCLTNETTARIFSRTPAGRQWRKTVKSVMCLRAVRLACHIPLRIVKSFAQWLIMDPDLQNDGEMHALRCVACSIAYGHKGRGIDLPCPRTLPVRSCRRQVSIFLCTEPTQRAKETRGIRAGARHAGSLSGQERSRVPAQCTHRFLIALGPHPIVL